MERGGLRDAASFDASALGPSSCGLFPLDSKLESQQHRENFPDLLLKPRVLSFQRGG